MQLKIKKGGKYQESVQSSTTPDPGYHMGKWQNTINITNESQEVGWPQDSNEQTRKHDKHKT